MKFTIEDLQRLFILDKLSKQTLTWLSVHGVKIELATGDQMFSQGQPAEYMFIVVSGKIQRYEDIGGQLLVVATTMPGGVTGMLPFSRMTHYPGNAIAAEPSQVLRIDKTNFDELLTISHELGQRLVAEMSNRVRNDVRLEQQQEKMASLGRLSAGLAHELNNPAAAISRTAANLTDHIIDHTARTMTIVRLGLMELAIDAIESLRSVMRQREIPKLSPIERSDREENLEDWLEGQAVADSWELSSIFTDFGLLTGDLEPLAEAVPKAVLSDIIAWVAADIELDGMVTEIRSSAGRISELVTSVKSYSHMDQSSAHKPTHLSEGLDNTFKLLGHKLKQKNIHLNRSYEDNLPAIPGNAGELNQVWTNLIDNAIDAMTEGGKLRVEIGNNHGDVYVKIIDDGCGIPDHIRQQIFDPFFTTKIVGEGTGLGLDIAQRIVHLHQGHIDVQSKAGETEFTVTLPIVPKMK